MRLALDTNAYSILQKGSSPKLRNLAEMADELYLPFIVAGELSAGFRRGSQSTKNNQRLRAFLQSDNASMLYGDDNTVNLYAEIWAELSRSGKMIPTNDIWIAALCIQNECALATNDRHFEEVPLLQTVPAK